MQTIYLDVSNKGVVPTIYAKQGEVGRKFTAVLTDAGVPYVLDESDLLSAWYEGTSGIGNYTTVGGNSAFTVDGNKVAIELITQMLTNDGDGVLSVSINKTDGSEIATWNIPYLVEKKPGADSPEAESFYTAFSEIAGQVADYASRAEAAAENLENITPESIGSLPAIESASHPGCYYRMVGDEREWINPPMVLGEEYRTTERYNGSPVCTKLVDFGALTNTTYKNVQIGVSGDKIVDIIARFRWASGEEFAKDINYQGGGSWYLYNSAIVVRAMSDLSNYVATFTVKYIK